MQETDTHLKKFLKAVKPGRRNSCVEKFEVEGRPKEENSPAGIKSQVCSVLLLQVWPSQDSPKGESNEGSFAFSKEESFQYEDSGIDSVQVSPSPVNLLQTQPVEMAPSPTLSDRRPSRTLLHPDHAKLMVQRSGFLPPLDYHPSHEGTSKVAQNGGFFTSPLSSSAASSITSIAGGPAHGSHSSDPIHNCESRRSSTMTNRYSLLDALDLEYALIKAAARGSIGPYSLSQSLQKLTFTQSLAFPALARGLSNKRNSTQSNPRSALDPLDSGVNAFAKVVTVLVLVLISVLVFGVLYKFIRT